MQNGSAHFSLQYGRAYSYVQCCTSLFSTKPRSATVFSQNNGHFLVWVHTTTFLRKEEGGGVGKGGSGGNKSLANAFPLVGAECPVIFCQVFPKIRNPKAPKKELDESELLQSSSSGSDTEKPLGPGVNSLLNTQGTVSQVIPENRRRLLVTSNALHHWR